jgi:hypothetical protein
MVDEDHCINGYYLEKRSEHGHVFYTTIYEDMIPFAIITEEQARSAPRPFICNEIHPRLGMGVVLTDMQRAIVDLPYMPTKQRAKRERNIANRNIDTRVDSRTIPAARLDAGEVWSIGEAHFKRYKIEPVEIERLVEYMRGEGLDALVLSVAGGDGRVLGHDFSILDPGGRMGWPQTAYGIFCCWDMSEPKRKLGRYSIMKVVEELGRRGYSRYDLGSSSIPGTGEWYAYKNDFATHFEPSRWICIIDPAHPIIAEYDIDPALINQIKKGETIKP